MIRAVDNYPHDSLKEKIARPIVVVHAGPDQAQTTDVNGQLFRALKGIEHRHGKHPTTLQHVRQHLPITRLKDIKR